jgi:hypothetical protein
MRHFSRIRIRAYIPRGGRGGGREGTHCAALRYENNGRPADTRANPAANIISSIRARARARISRVFARKLPSSGSAAALRPRRALPRSTADVTRSRYPRRPRARGGTPEIRVSQVSPSPSPRRRTTRRSRDLWPNFDLPLSPPPRPAHSRADAGVPFHRAASPSRGIRGVRYRWDRVNASCFA